MSLTRRRLLAVAGAGGAAAAALAAWWWPEQGLWNPCLGPLPRALADHPVVRDAWAGLDPRQLWDTHVHLIADAHGGLGFGEEGGLVERAFTWVQAPALRNAACLGEAAVGQEADAYAERLHALAAALPAGRKLLLLALDARHDALGRRDAVHTHIQVANDACAAVVRRWPARFEWAASVHPYRVDAVAAIMRARRDGARAIKWIPSAQGIDPASPRCDRAYEAMARLDLPLITHAGQERAAPGDDALGNPLRLRRALEHGVRVVVAHCASMGFDRDLDRGAAGAWIESFALFERLMDEPAHVGRLFGDLSALTQNARAGRPLRRVLDRAREGGDWARRLLDGSDYPLPALMPLYSPRRLAEHGLLARAAVEPLTAIRRHDPLLFDFVLKRQLRSGGRGLAAAVFETRRFFEPEREKFG